MFIRIFRILDYPSTYVSSGSRSMPRSRCWIQYCHPLYVSRAGSHERIFMHRFSM